MCPFPVLHVGAKALLANGLPALVKVVGQQFRRAFGARAGFARWCIVIFRGVIVNPAPQSHFVLVAFLAHVLPAIVEAAGDKFC